MLQVHKGSKIYGDKSWGHRTHTHESDTLYTMKPLQQTSLTNLTLSCSKYPLIHTLDPLSHSPHGRSPHLISPAQVLFSSSTNIKQSAAIMARRVGRCGEESMGEKGGLCVIF